MHQIHHVKSFKRNKTEFRSIEPNSKNIEILKKFGSREAMFNSVRFGSVLQARKVLEFHCIKFYLIKIFKALELSPGNRAILVERASCYFKTGKFDLALADAEESLKESKEFTKV